MTKFPKTRDECNLEFGVCWQTEFHWRWLSAGTGATTVDFEATSRWFAPNATATLGEVGGEW
jgi:hypothetical protein